MSAIFRAYNGWLAEFCRTDPARLKGIAMINLDDVEDGLRELERAAHLGLSGAMITSSLGRGHHCRHQILVCRMRIGEVPPSRKSRLFGIAGEARRLGDNIQIKVNATTLRGE